MFTNYPALQNITQVDVDAFVLVCKIANKIGEFEASHPDDWPAYRCHSVCRAIAKHVTGLTVVDGDYLGIKQTKSAKGLLLKERFYPHTWLLSSRRAIIDPYPVGVFSPKPLLIPTRGRWAPFGAGLYIRNDSLTSKFMKPKVLREIEVLSEHIAKLLLNGVK